MARTQERLGFVDAGRAVAVLGMLFANMMNVFLHRVPAVLRHNQGDQLRAFDLPAPVFQFLIGVSLVLFLGSRAARGLSRTRARLTAARRFVLLIGLGIVLDTTGAMSPWPRWGVLQTLGLGGLVAAAVADLPDAAVAALALALLAVFFHGDQAEVHASPVAALAFAPLTLAGLLAGRGLAAGTGRRPFIRRAAVIAVAGLAIATAARLAGVPFNKILGTSSFVALASAASAMLLLATAALELGGVVFPPWLLALGGNALTAWVLQYVLVYYPSWLVFWSWRRLPLLPGMLAAVAALGVLGALTLALGRRGIRIPI
jgi:heparan-alpha-glucosaminide N-acetyltransferase-like protein